MKRNSIFIEYEFSVYYIPSVILIWLGCKLMVTYYYICWSEYKKKVVRQKTSENMEYMVQCSEKIKFFNENMENENTHFISISQ